MKNIVIIDYGSGNLKSVFNAIQKVTEKKSYNIKVSNLSQDLKNASHIILPGVGSFESCVNGLKKLNIEADLNKAVLQNKTPFLGICVGMQMLATKGFENGEFDGLDWIRGTVEKIKVKDKKFKIPHMGWNILKVKKETPFIKHLLQKIKIKSSDEISAYFVHSYNFKTKEQSNKILTTEYESEIAAMVSKENIIGTQFHPEKSHIFGLNFLETFFEQKEF